MARVQGVKEKLHSPIYDAFFVKSSEKVQDAINRQDPRMIRFFVDVQSKTKLETNLQSSGVLPSLNTFECRAMRVLVSPVDKANNANVLTSDILAQLIYNSVTSLLVGEKIMIEMPTYWFPAGAGVSPGNDNVSNLGEPDAMATFRFAEPVPIEPQQNFRVEMAFPQGVPGSSTTSPSGLAGVTGPLRIWVVLDGYLTRDVQ